MAASHIPNLNTLRNGRGTSRARGRGPGGRGQLLGASSITSSEEQDRTKDKIVQQTDQDASVSRLSAVEAGYLDDPFAKHFVKGEGQRRFPIINRGTYVRTKAIDNLVAKFLSKDPSQKKQIISLGAGTDTRFFRLMKSCPRNDGTGGYDRPNVIYHEVDFPSNTVQKLDPVRRLSEFYRHVASPWLWMSSTSTDRYAPPDTLTTGNYHCHPVDLRSLGPSCTLPRTFENIDTTLPTLVLSECCLCYLAPAVADTVALYFTQHLFPATTPVGLVLYESINPNDAFGKTMVANLAVRGIVLQTLVKYGSLEAQAARMRSYGLGSTGGASIKDLWDHGVEEKEKERVAGLEMMDEVEEWDLLAAHYCVAWGWRGGQEVGVWDGWKRMAETMSGNYTSDQGRNGVQKFAVSGVAGS